MRQTRFPTFWALFPLSHNPPAGQSNASCDAPQCIVGSVFLWLYGFTRNLAKKMIHQMIISRSFIHAVYCIFFFYYSIICHCLSYKLQELLSFYLIGYFFQFIDCLSLDWWLDVLYCFIFRLKGQLVGIWIKNKEWADILICLSSAVYESRSRQTNDQTNLNYVKIAVELTINKNKVA